MIYCRREQKPGPRAAVFVHLRAIGIDRSERQQNNVGQTGGYGKSMKDKEQTNKTDPLSGLSGQTEKGGSMKYSFNSRVSLSTHSKSIINF